MFVGFSVKVIWQNLSSWPSLRSMFYLVTHSKYGIEIYIMFSYRPETEKILVTVFLELYQYASVTLHS